MKVYVLLTQFGYETEIHGIYRDKQKAKSQLEIIHSGFLLGWIEEHEIQ